MKNGPNRCLVCQRIVPFGQGVRFQKDDVVVQLHDSCLQLLSSVVQKALDYAQLAPPSTRPKSLSEFLHEKRPENQSEILACTASFLEIQAGGVVEFSTTEIREVLVTTTVQIKDFGIALSNAVRRTPYIARVGKRDGQWLYRLTEEGARLVKNLPRSGEQ